ncbi:MAG TPA: hypothetical protein VNM47_13955 [Terriglobia bacterium]|nr:hypothetical protein [Terriglobia bacterium]
MRGTLEGLKAIVGLELRNRRGTRTSCAEARAFLEMALVVASPRPAIMTQLSAPPGPSYLYSPPSAIVLET